MITIVKEIHAGDVYRVPKEYTVLERAFVWDRVDSQIRLRTMYVSVRGTAKNEKDRYLLIPIEELLAFEMLEPNPIGTLLWRVANHESLR